MTRKERGKALFKSCKAILQQHKSLLVFPAVGYLCKYAIFAAIITPFIKRKELHLLHQKIPIHTTVTLIISFALLLFVVNAILFFFNAAIIENLLCYFKKQQPPSISFGFIRAFKSYTRVFGWALFTGIYGIMANLLPKNGEYFQRTRQWLHHNHWQIASQFGLIHIIDQKILPILAFQKSSTLVAKLWGSHLRQNYALSGKFILWRLAAFIPLIIGSIIGSHTALISGSAVTIALMLIVSTVSQLTYTTIRVATYCFAKHQIELELFPKEIINSLYKYN